MIFGRSRTRIFFPLFLPVALHLLKAPESFTLRGRKTGNERRAPTPIVDEMRCKSDRETSSKADEKTCPEHHSTPRTVGSWCTAVAIAAHCGASRSYDFVTHVAS